MHVNQFVSFLFLSNKLNMEENNLFTIHTNNVETVKSLSYISWLPKEFKYIRTFG